MDQVDIDFEWHCGVQFHQGKRASSTIRFAMIPLLLQELFWNLFAMLKHGMDQVDINFECHRGAHFHQGK